MEKIFYQCFSERLNTFLVSRGHKVLLVAKHVITDKMFWCFIINDKREKDLMEWSSIKKKK